MRQTSWPERTRSLPNRDLEACHVELGVQSLLDLGWTGRLEKQLKCFDEISPGLLNSVALAGDVELRAERDIAIALPLDQRGHLLDLFHHLILFALLMNRSAGASPTLLALVF